jgi:hypothetical protein
MDETTACCSKYPWHLLVRTLALLLAFLTYGINANLFGPTLLDLKVKYSPGLLPSASVADP